MTKPAKTAFLLIDVQYDFLDGGALEVPGSKVLIPEWVQLAASFSLRFATQDWHPPGHVSFASAHPGKGVYDTLDRNGLSQTLWPDHCVAGSPGARMPPELENLGWNAIVHKGIHPDADSYSGFFDNEKRYSTALREALERHGVRRLLVAGLATDYCVQATVLDACDLGYPTGVASWLCKAVDVQEGDGHRALERMKQAGARILARHEQEAWQNEG
jgi:nicotinamidase/pyrazinamidase